MKEIIKLTENDLKEIILEELGISLIVVDKSKEIYNNIMDNLKQQEMQKSEICTFKVGVIECTIDDIKFHISYTCRYFKDDTFIKEYGEEYFTEGASAFLSKNFIYCNINLYAISGTINKKLALSTIQHEIEHIFQEIKAEKSFPTDNDKYATMATDMQSKDIIYHDIARLVYCCYNTEQEGFINGTYAYCMTDNFNTNPFSSEPYTFYSILKTPAGQLYQELMSLYKKLLNNKDMQKLLKDRYNMSLKEVEKSIDRFKRKLGRLIIKINHDKGKNFRF